MRALLALALLLFPAVAAAETPKELVALFAHTEVSKVTAARGVRLEGVRDYQQMVVGTYHEGEWDQHVLILMRCGKTQCTGKTVWLGNEKPELQALIDLAGAPGPLDQRTRIDLEHRGDWHLTLEGKGKKFPALVLAVREEKVTTGGSRFRGTVKGSERHHKLLVISLRKSEEAAPRIAQLATVDTYPSGAGVTSSYALVRSGKQRVLDIAGTSQGQIENDSACLRPEPVEHLWKFKGGRYEQVDDLLQRTGCRH